MSSNNMFSYKILLHVASVSSTFRAYTFTEFATPEPEHPVSTSSTQLITSLITTSILHKYPQTNLTTSHLNTSSFCSLSISPSSAPKATRRSLPSHPSGPPKDSAKAGPIGASSKNKHRAYWAGFTNLRVACKLLWCKADLAGLSTA
jgi:hypothetical protein